MNIKPHILTALILTSVSAWAQQPQQGGPPMGGGQMNRPPGMGMQPQGGSPGGGGLERNFFPPEMVMRNQKALNLTGEQQNAIKSEMQKSMSKFTELQWEQSAAEEAMDELVKQDRPDEKKVLAQLDKLLDIENQMKRLHLTTMIRIKNILTPEQQDKLRNMRKEPRGQMQGMPMRQRDDAASGDQQPPARPPDNE